MVQSTHHILMAPIIQLALNTSHATLLSFVSDLMAAFAWGTWSVLSSIMQPSLILFLSVD